MNRLYKKSSNEELRKYILYLLSYFYYKSKDTSTAEKKLKECLILRTNKKAFMEFFKPKSPIEIQALDLLDNILTYEMKPIWWNWWLSSFHYRRKILFIFSLSSIVLLSVLHPFIPKWFSIEINWSIYILLIVFLVFVLLSPVIRGFRAGGLEVELHPPSSHEPVLSTSGIEEEIEILTSRYVRSLSSDR